MHHVPSNRDLRGDLIKESDLTVALRRHLYRRLNTETAEWVMHYWFRLAHWVLRNLALLRDGTHLTLYSSAIWLASTGSILPAALVGGTGIVVSKRLSEIQTLFQARKMAYDSIREHEKQKRERRRLDPLA
jgi:hypothetical protein